MKIIYVYEGSYPIPEWMLSSDRSPSRKKKGLSPESPSSVEPRSGEPRGVCARCSGQPSPWNKGMKFGRCLRCKNQTYIRPLI